MCCECARRILVPYPIATVGGRCCFIGAISCQWFMEVASLSGTTAKAAHGDRLVRIYLLLIYFVHV